MSYEIEFLSVGDSNGDAICVRYGNPLSGFVIHVVDGGYAPTGQTIIDHINKYYGAPKRIDHVVLTHADNDHVSGLLDVVRYFEVGALWMNRPWLYAAEIVGSFHGNYTAEGLFKTIRAAYPLVAQLEEIAIAKGVPIYEAFAGTQIGAFTVLAPTRDRYLELIPDFNRTPTSYDAAEKGFMDRLVEAAKTVVRFLETWTSEALQENPSPTSASNESCIVQLADFDGRTALLTADAGPSALKEAAQVAAYLGRLSAPTFVQIPHHGSRRNVTPSVLNIWLGPPLPEGSKTVRGTAFCSVGVNKPEYPRKRVSNAFIRRGYNVHRSGTGWIRHYYDIPRENMKPLTPMPFSSAYEE
ncbi:hypothetical protein B5M44_21465 [Shinella sumterensis]|uniref:ComEC/Rec2 family competence protein n=1 Tax=Shinella sumterensis TaxID=1967501 RepID=UPI00106EBDC4|nr:MBL fold metallo-hydrolase [Shinella sumterensis]MCD1266855.1 MBL fold metallo-hydrolase [Shinella sumterensis]TFE95286.1 hypothetical protein B5M44_21465 [Shinella sumterensis]